MPNQIRGSNRAAQAALGTVVLAMTVMAQTGYSSAQFSQPCAGAELRPRGKESAPRKERAPAGHGHTLGIVTGDPQSTDFTIAHKMAKAVGTGQKVGAHHEMGLRLVPMVGSGSFQNILDLLTLPGADM